jgi:hypothetical protein
MRKKEVQVGIKVRWTQDGAVVAVGQKHGQRRKATSAER